MSCQLKKEFVFIQAAALEGVRGPGLFCTDPAREKRENMLAGSCCSVL